jgi:hypothetical protein
MDVMNLAELEHKLIAAARVHPPSEQVPYAFEQRILAQLRARPALDPTAFWARAMWRGALSCVAVVLLLGAFDWFSPNASDLNDHLDDVVLAGVPHETDF